MKSLSKRILSLALVLLMVFSLAAVSFAADDDITPTTGTITVYSSSSSGGGWVNVELAWGNKNFTIKRSDVKVTEGTAGAVFEDFSKYSSTSTYDTYTGSEWSSSSSAYCYYDVGIYTSKAGSFKITYKIGTTSYTITVKVLAYTNPVKSIILDPINKGKTFASKTKTSNYCSDLTVPSTTKNSYLKVVPNSGWKIRYIYFNNRTSGTSRNMQNYSSGLSSAVMPVGPLRPTSRYYFYVTFVNTSNNATIQLYYDVYNS